jgi:hypothetical protein
VGRNSAVLNKDICLRCLLSLYTEEVLEHNKYKLILEKDFELQWNQGRVSYCTAVSAAKIGKFYADIHEQTPELCPFIVEQVVQQ